jgi:hypothetical protein
MADEKGEKGVAESKKNFMRFIKIGFYGAFSIIMILFSGLVVGFYSFFKEMGKEGQREWILLQKRIKEI